MKHKNVLKHLSSFELGQCLWCYALEPWSSPITQNLKLLKPQRKEQRSGAFLNNCYIFVPETAHYARNASFRVAKLLANLSLLHFGKRKDNLKL